MREKHVSFLFFRETQFARLAVLEFNDNITDAHESPAMREASFRHCNSLIDTRHIFIWYIPQSCIERMPANSHGPYTHHCVFVLDKLTTAQFSRGRRKTETGHIPFRPFNAERRNKPRIAMAMMMPNG